MSAPATPVSEEDLHAYVDGRLDAERRDAVDRYLRDHPDVAASITTDIFQRNALHEAFRAYAAAPTPRRLNLSGLVEERLRRRRAPWRVAAAIMLGFGVGAGGGLWLGSRPSTGISALTEEAAVSYAVYAVDQRRPIEIAAEHRNDMTRWLSKRLNQRVAPPNLSTLGYELLGGRLVATPSGPAALFVYESAQGKRLILYVRPMTGQSETTVMEAIDVNHLNLDGCSWIERGVGYSLIADEDYARLLELSQYVRKEITLRP
jgi:anti-sigma factor RsiW